VRSPATGRAQGRPGRAGRGRGIKKDAPPGRSRRSLPTRRCRCSGSTPPVAARWSFSRWVVADQSLRRVAFHSSQKRLLSLDEQRAGSGRRSAQQTQHRNCSSSRQPEGVVYSASAGIPEESRKSRVVRQHIVSASARQPLRATRFCLYTRACVCTMQRPEVVADSAMHRASNRTHDAASSASPL